MQTTGPTLLGVDVILVGSILAGIAALATLMAIYAALTVRDPMAKRVKSLNARREELKLGLMTEAQVKRRTLRRKTDLTDKVRDYLSKFSMLQDSQIKEIEQKLMQAGIRRKELAYVVVAARVVLPIVFGFIAAVLVYWTDTYPEWGPMKRLAVFAGSLAAGYYGPGTYLKNKVGKRTDPLASALRVLSAEFRNERMMRAEEKAARLPAIMTVPLILFILPVLFIVILGPAACSISDALL